MENKYLSTETYPETSYSEGLEGKATPFVHRDLRKSLEEIVKEPKQKKECFLRDLFSDKARTLKASVNAFLEEIKLREDLNVEQSGFINAEICRQHTDLMQLDNIRDCYPFDLTKDVDEAKAKIKSNVLELEREKRSEGLECWRDLMFLKKYLMVSLKDYWELARKRGVLEE